MAYADPNSLHNPSTGTSPPASWGDNVRDNIVWLAGDAASGNPKPMCRIYNDAAESIATSTLTALTFNGERYDVGGMHSTSSNTSRVTVPSGGAGVYHIGAQIRYASNGTGTRAISLRVNGTTYIASFDLPAISGTDMSLAISCDYKLAVADYVEVVVWQSSGGLLDVNSDSARSPEFWCHWVGVG